MKPQTLNLNSEALNSFRNNFDFALAHMLRQMQEKGLQSGTITGKLKIEMDQYADEHGIMHRQLEIAPDVSIKLGYSASMGGDKVRDLELKWNMDKDPIVGTNQISMDELEGGA